MINGIQYAILGVGILFVLSLVLIVGRLEMSMIEIACETFGHSGMPVCD